MAKTNTGLVAYAKAMLGKPYWYGTFGQIGTEALYKSKKNQYPSYYVRSNYTQGWEHQYGQRVHDCVGLIKGYLWSDTTTSTPKYNSAQDVSANGMLTKCKEKGAIGTIPELPGVLVFYPGHVGVYEGNGNVIEAMGHSQGVVRTKLKDRPWKNWGKCPWIDYSASENKPTITVTVKKKTLDELAEEVIAGKWGSGEERKNKINNAYKAGSIDYGYATIQKCVNETLKANADAKTVKVGSKVKVKSGAKSYEGKKVSLFVYLKTYTVDELKGDRAVLNKKGICTAFNVKDLIVQ
jgi:hypothetical protein